ncbi:MAG: T9SS type A sorting domain-containing protein [Bacteroidetes bacterium]|nr:T9SS type A sorting domain-containing protein [Bacteroidota bacterium]
MKKFKLLILAMFGLLYINYAQIPTVTYLNLPTGFKYSKSTHLHEFNNKIYFFAYDVNHRPKLMASDGTQAGTIIVFDIYPGNTLENDNIYWACVVDTKLFFFTRQEFSGGNYIDKLWVSDGTAAGTQVAKEMYAGDPVAYKGKLYYYGAEGMFGSSNSGLWVSDGTYAGTYLFQPSLCCGDVASTMGEVNGKLLFSVSDCTHSRELWATDGTSTGTQFIKDINPGFYASTPSKGVVLGSKYYFAATDSSSKSRVWFTDGTANGTALLNETVVMPDYQPEPIFLYNSKIYLSATNNDTNALYISDGTDTGTHLVANIGKAPFCERPRHFCGYKDNVYFSADSGDTYNVEFWVTDGTNAGTKQIMDIFPGNGSSSPSHFITYNNYLYFRADKYAGSYQLFQSNGSSLGTQNVTFALIEDDMIKHGSSLYAAIDYAILKIDDTTGTGLSVPLASEKPEHFSLYPNPNNGSFTLQLDNTDFKNGNITIYDIVGREVYQSQIINRTSQINLNVSEGVYMVKLQVDNTSSTQRLIIQ